MLRLPRIIWLSAAYIIIIILVSAVACGDKQECGNTCCPSMPLSLSPHPLPGEHLTSHLHFLCRLVVRDYSSFAHTHTHTHTRNTHTTRTHTPSQVCIHTHVTLYPWQVNWTCVCLCVRDVYVWFTTTTTTQPDEDKPNKKGKGDGDKKQWEATREQWTKDEDKKVDNLEIQSQTELI